MADERDQKDLGLHMRRAGNRIPIVELPDRFTVRLKRGEKVAADYCATHRRRLRRQDLEEYSVDAEERDTVMHRARRGNDVELASHVYAPAEEPQAKLHLTDQITVHFKPEVSDDEIEKITTEPGLSLVKEIRGGEVRQAIRPAPPRVHWMERNSVPAACRLGSNPSSSPCASPISMPASSRTCCGHSSPGRTESI